MRTVKTNVYTFDELPEKAQQRAIDNHRYDEIEYDWWDQVDEDARMIGCKIETFDIDQRYYCNLTTELSWSDVARQILNQHGVNCDTWMLANEFLLNHETVSNQIEDAEDSNNDENLESLYDDLGELEDGFQKNLAGEYLKMLRDEYEYLTTDECVKERLEDDSQYEFTVDGKDYHG